MWVPAGRERWDRSALGGCVVALRRWRSSRETEFSPKQVARAADAEIDMRRPAPRRSTILHKFSRLLQSMLPQGNSIGPPMRSVGRELEEIFPSDER
jgi:hypothetical protein